MMFLSFFKKKDSSASDNVVANPIPQPVVKTAELNLEQPIEDSINLPGWKDKAIWTESSVKLLPKAQQECQELQYAITGNAFCCTIM